VHPVHLLFLAAVFAVGWFLRDKYGRWPLAEPPALPIPPAPPAPPPLDPEETEILAMFRESRSAEEAAAAAKRKEDFRKGVAGKLQAPPPAT